MLSIPIKLRKFLGMCSS